MSRSRKDPAGLLRWYPPAWRERYGDELIALMEDEMGDQGPSVTSKLSIARAGLRERCHEVGLVGDQLPPAERIWAGSLLVLCAWTVFVLAGASFSKTSEHFAQAVPLGSRTMPQDAFDVVAALGVAGLALVGLGAVAVVPAFVRFLRGGGWPAIRGHILGAIALTAVMSGSLVPLASWAHHLTEVQRNGGDGIYSAAITVWALLVAVTLAQWTAAGVAAARRIELSQSLVSLEAVCAVALAGVMVVITVATGLWWGAMANSAPWFLSGTAAGTRPSPFTSQLVVTMTMMLAAVLVAGYGTFRVTTASPST